MSTVGMRAKTGANGIRRFAARALLAVGGAVAGTAIAWALSTTSAQAAEAPQADLVSKVATSDLVSVTPTEKFVAKVDETLRAEQQKARAALPAVEVPNVVGQVADWVQPRIAEVVPTDKIFVSSQAAPVTTPAATKVEQAPAQPVLVAPQSAVSSGVQWTKLLETHHAVVSSDQHPSLPADPSPQLPVPAKLPAHCGCASDGSGSAGGSNFAAQAASGNAHDSAVARALKPSTDEVSVTPGKQPGITPD